MAARLLVLTSFIGGAAGVHFPGQDFVCSGLNSSSAEIDVLCPSVVAGSANVTMVDCEDAARLILGKAESLLGCPGTSSNPPVSQAVKDAACVFMRREEVNSTDILQSLCNRFGTMLSEPCTSVLQSAWTDLESSCDDVSGSLVTPQSSSPAVTTELQFPGEDAICAKFNASDASIKVVCPQLQAEGFSELHCEQALRVIVRRAQRASHCPGYWGKNSTIPAAGRKIRVKGCIFVEETLKIRDDVTDMFDQLCPSISGFDTCTNLLIKAWLDYVDTCRENEPETTTAPATVIV
uniref:Uncharacterized protein n=1 Tax=Noctiluca scintillans TaxID=2966 RepID=A0A7S1A074_NOCSC|mmetsp:Transcript_26494/g.69638  ORF Transcript_26494/g.69638 Transcript_26494/m.69638 type:complete len:293 (+) Transcript_26494:68-946(+)